MGLGYEEMKKLRPDIIYLSMSGFGTRGVTETIKPWEQLHKPCPV